MPNRSQTTRDPLPVASTHGPDDEDDPAGTQETTPPRLPAAKAFYFCFYAAGAALLPFLALHYSAIGLSGRTIGLLSGLPPLITLVAAPLWGGVADVTRRHKQLLLLAMAGAIGAMLALSTATRIIWLVPLVVLYAFFAAPIIPLVDNSVLALLDKRKELYGKQRVWGAIGWGVAAAIMGYVTERLGLGWAFYGYALFLGTGMVAAAILPIAPAGIGSKFRHGLRLLAGNPVWVIFLIAVFSAGMTAGIYNNFLFLYLESLGAPRTLMGLSLVIATLSEMPVFFFSDRLLRRFGARGLLLLSLAAHLVRMFAYAAMTAPWMVLPIHLLHGPTFSAMWAAGVATADDLAPPGMGATAQGLFTGVTMGLGSAAGALLGGQLYDGLGPVWMFRTGGVIVGLGLLFYLFAPAVQRARTSTA